MALKYQALLSPIQIRNVILKNRMMSSASTPHFLQGTEKNPTEKIITHFANRARNGAAAVAINHFQQDYRPSDVKAIDNPPGHFNLFDVEDYSAQNYFCQLIDAIHFYGSKANANLRIDMDAVYPRQGGMPPMPEMSNEPACTENDVGDIEMGPGGEPIESYTKEMLQRYAQYAGEQARDMARLGFDIISLHSCYRNATHAKFLSPLTNHRTDEYGGSMANRSRLLLDVCREMRKAVGPNVLLEVIISVNEPEGGYTVDDTVEFCRLADGIVDIIHLRAGEQDPQHPTGFSSTEDKPVPYYDEMAYVCQQVHKLGLNLKVAASGGFQDPEVANRMVAEGKADLIYMARSWINNPDYGKKVYEGRGEDIVPCIRCNKCHVANGKDMWRSVCSVNPTLGFEDKLDRMVPPVGPEKKVAIVGGGPAGMECARVAAERGHSVTLYEASDKLGGQLKHADYASFKWPLKHFKDFMITQMDKDGVDVHLNTPATPELLSGQGYDVVVAAVGSTPSAPKLPGIDGANVHYAAAVYGQMEDQLSDDIVMIGGGEIGVETALYLCEVGKHVTVLEMLPELISDAAHAHYKNMVHSYWRKQPNFRFKCGVKVTSIDPDGVNYTDYKGETHKIACGDVLLAIGSRPLADEAMKFAGVADRFVAIGDCQQAANVQHAMRSGWSAAVNL